MSSGEASPVEADLLENEHRNGTYVHDNHTLSDKSNYVPPASSLYDNDTFLNDESTNKNHSSNGNDKNYEPNGVSKIPVVPHKEGDHSAVGDAYMRYDDLVEDDGTGNAQRKAILSDHGMILAPQQTKSALSKVWFKRLVAFLFAGGVITVLVIILIIVAEKSKNENDNVDLFPLSAPNCDHPVYCQGPILAAVQAAWIFDDQKTFVDMPIKRNPTPGVTINSASDLLAIYKDQSSKPGFNITTFVTTYFDPAGSEVVTVLPSDFKPVPEYTLNPKSVTNPNILNFSIDVHQAWKSLMRTFNVSAPQSTSDNSPYCSDCHSSIYAANPFVVPGGRFTEFYYWDSLWIIEGLLVSEMFETAQGMIENFIDMIDRFGFMPNGARVYYLSRSQLPMLSDMVYAFYQACMIAANATQSANSDISNNTYAKMGAAVIEKALPALLKEHAFFVESHHRVVGADFSGAAAQRILDINNGGKVHDYSTTPNEEDPYAGTILGNNFMWLNRFFTDTEGPRPESYMEDIATADSVYPLDKNQPVSSQADTVAGRDWIFSQLAAGAETGYDYTVRWFNNTKNSFYPPEHSTDNWNNRNNYANISTIQVENIIPADLNAILLSMEERIATWTNGDKTTNGRTIPASVTSLDSYLISPRNGVLYDEVLVATTGGSLVNSATSLTFAGYANRRRRSMTQILMAPSPFTGTNSTSDRISFSDFNHQSGTWSLTEQTERTKGMLPSVYYSGFVTPYMIPSIATYHLSESQQIAFINDMASFVDIGGAPASNASVPDSTGSPQQWDYANGWAPTQYFISRALKLSESFFATAAANPNASPSEATANTTLSQQATTVRKDLVQKWINNCYCGWQVPYPQPNPDGTTTVMHALMEKYHVNTDDGSSGNGGEYVPQLGFGWTNGLSLYFVREDGSWLTSPPLQQCTSN